MHERMYVCRLMRQLRWKALPTTSSAGVPKLTKYQSLYWGLLDWILSLWQKAVYWIAVLRSGSDFANNYRWARLSSQCGGPQWYVWVCVCVYIYIYISVCVCAGRKKRNALLVNDFVVPLQTLAPQQNSARNMRWSSHPFREALNPPAYLPGLDFESKPVHPTPRQNWLRTSHCASSCLVS